MVSPTPIITPPKKPRQVADAKPRQPQPKRK